MSEAETKKDSLPSEKSTNRLTPAVAVGSVLGIFFLAPSVVINVISLVGFALGKNEDQIKSWLQHEVLAQFFALMLLAIVGIVAVHWLLKWANSSWQAIGLKKPQLKDVGLSILGYGWYMLLFMGVMFLVSQYLPVVNLNQQQQLGFDRNATDGFVLILTGLSLVAIPAFYEEVLMRGVMFTGLRSRLSFTLTAIIVSVLFAIAHLEWMTGGSLHWAAAIDTGILAVILVYLREKSQSLWPAIFLHAIKNLVAFTVVFVLKRG